MPGQQYTPGSGKPYLQVAGGNLVQKVDKTTPGARHREYELPNGTKGEKWELVYSSWTGKIQSITFKENEYGESCHIDLGDAILTLSTSSRYFTDLACRLCGADLNKDITFKPYQIEKDGGGKVTGVSVQQAGEKLKNYFYDAENKVKLHGFPEVDDSKTDRKAYWKSYFLEVTEFLIKQLKNIKPEKCEDFKPGDVLEDGAPLPSEEIEVDLPF